MGIELLLHRHHNAALVVEKINEIRRRCWPASIRTDLEREQFKEICKALDMQGNDRLPPDAQEIIFESARLDMCPTRIKVGGLSEMLNFLELTPLHSMFGFASIEPEDIYAIPDWQQCYSLLHNTVDQSNYICTRYFERHKRNWFARLKLGTQSTQERRLTRYFEVLADRYRSPKIIVLRDPESIALNHIAHLQGLEEMVQWILEQPQREDFFVCWSW